MGGGTSSAGGGNGKADQAGGGTLPGDDDEAIDGAPAGAACKKGKVGGVYQWCCTSETTAAYFAGRTVEGCASGKLVRTDSSCRFGTRNPTPGVR